MLSIYSWFGYKMPGEELYKAIKAAGFHATTLWWGNKNHEDYELHPKYARAAGLTIEHIHAPYERVNDIWVKDKGQDILDIHMQCIEACAVHQIPTMVMHLSGGDNPPPFNQFGLDRIHGLLDFAEKMGVNIAMENLKKPAYLDYVLDNIDATHLGFCYDSGHHNLFAPGEDLLKKHGSRIMAMHLHDNFGKIDEHLLPFDGQINWSATTKGLAQMKYRTISLEVGNKGYERLPAQKFLKFAFLCAKKIEDWRDENA